MQHMLPLLHSTPSVAARALPYLTLQLYRCFTHVFCRRAGQAVPESGYEVTPKSLTLLCPPAGPFELEVVTAIKPQDNSLLEGLYKSGGNYCTQVGLRGRGGWRCRDCRGKCAEDSAVYGGFTDDDMGCTQSCERLSVTSSSCLAVLPVLHAVWGYGPLTCDTLHIMLVVLLLLSCAVRG